MSQFQKILLVEDDENDVFFATRAMSIAGLPHPIHICTDGQEAIDYLSGTGPFADRLIHPFPECVFLDLKLPQVHGFQVLEWIRSQHDFKKIPVFILTSSPEESDRKRARQLGATDYLVKPPTVQTLIAAMALAKGSKS